MCCSPLVVIPKEGLVWRDIRTVLAISFHFHHFPHSKTFAVCKLRVYLSCPIWCWPHCNSEPSYPCSAVIPPLLLIALLFLLLVPSVALCYKIIKHCKIKNLLLFTTHFLSSDFEITLMNYQSHFFLPVPVKFEINLFWTKSGWTFYIWSCSGRLVEDLRVDSVSYL